jgi:hypothetical protein
MQVGDLVQISPARNGHSIGIIVEQTPTKFHGKQRLLVHWFNPNGLGVASLVAWEHSDKLEALCK